MLVHSSPTALAAEHVLRVDDRAPGDDEAGLGQRLERDGRDQPLPGDVLKAVQRLSRAGISLSTA
jgi:hypothetical protein